MFIFRNRCFSNHLEYANPNLAKSQFEHATTRLFRVNDWSNLGAYTANFILYDSNVIHTSTLIEVGSYIKITFPFPVPVNWVKVTEIYTDDSLAYFVVHPTRSPENGTTETVAHFLKKQSKSVFKVERTGAKVYGYEIGRNELINNAGKQSGSRKLINTLMAWGGWLGLQRYQWGKLTNHFVGTPLAIESH